MATAEHPITRAEFRSEFDRFRDDIREHYATKADILGLENRMTDKINRLQNWMFGQILLVLLASSVVVIRTFLAGG